MYSTLEGGGNLSRNMSEILVKVDAQFDADNDEFTTHVEEETWWMYQHSMRMMMMMMSCRQ